MITGVVQLIPPVLSSETLLHILLSSEYSGFRPSTTAVVTHQYTRKSGSQSNLKVLFIFFSARMCCLCNMFVQAFGSLVFIQTCV